MSYLKGILNTTAKRVRNCLLIINNVYSFIPICVKLKVPSLAHRNRRRTFIQVCIEKYKFSLNGSCFSQLDENKQRRTFADCKKEMAARIKNAKIPLKWRGMKDIERSISRMLNLSAHTKVVNLSKKF
ncbi:hypothetical protein [Bacillus sp. Au-Bac7]|uniref:hypothetical protein n=1 Tax=Bacillus sp. Au-Bac7 TaxID=2906458 RepID=UPI001E39B5CE|nr:hypothetical protein [Bacillus sp. Au-Bac7]MCE4051696.1 hypothetical protein [Bacillus sp. Au-Bac7]